MNSSTSYRQDTLGPSSSSSSWKLPSVGSQAHLRKRNTSSSSLQPDPSSHDSSGRNYPVESHTAPSHQHTCMKNTAMVATALVLLVLVSIGLTGILHSNSVIGLPHALNWIAPIGTIGQGVMLGIGGVGIAGLVALAIKACSSQGKKEPAETLIEADRIDDDNSDAKSTRIGAQGPYVKGSSFAAASSLVVEWEEVKTENNISPAQNLQSGQFTVVPENLLLPGQPPFIVYKREQAGDDGLEGSLFKSKPISMEETLIFKQMRSDGYVFQQAQPASEAEINTLLLNQLIIESVKPQQLQQLDANIQVLKEKEYLVYYTGNEDKPPYVVFFRFNVNLDSKLFELCKSKPLHACSDYIHRFLKNYLNLQSPTT